MTPHYIFTYLPTKLSLRLRHESHAQFHCYLAEYYTYTHRKSTFMSSSEKEKMIAGELYKAFEPELISERERANTLFTTLNSLDKSSQDKRGEILVQLLGRCGENIWVESPFYCDYGSLISIGDNVFINFNCTILDAAPVVIGNNVMFGPNVHLYSATHPTDAATRAKGLEYAKPIEIQDDTWIGGSSVICPGVTVGARTVIGAGSVVTKDMPSDVVAAGNPCRVIRHTS